MNVLMRVAHDLKAWAKKETDRIEKATTGALYEATYQLYKDSRQALREGTLGLPQRVVLQSIRQARRETRARDGRAARLRSGKKAQIPLRTLAPGILYKVCKAEHRAEVGFVGQERGGKRIAQWAERLAGEHAPGYTILYDKDLRERLHGLGIHLKASTAQAKVPGRGIIDQAGAKFASRALEKLTDSFNRKMAGERT